MGDSTPSKNNEPESVMHTATQETMKFPSNIQSAEYGDQYFQLTSFSYDRQVKDDSTKNKAQFHVVLPVPAGLATAYNANFGSYQETGWNRIAHRAIGAAQEGFRVGKAGNTDWQSTLSGLIGGAARGGASLINSAMANSEAAQAELAGVLGDSFKSSFLRERGKAWRNTDVLAFEGMGIREWTFQWKLMPRNQSDIEQLIKIKNALVKFSHPTAAGDFFLGYPNYFAFVIRDLTSSEATVSRMLPKSGPCFLTNVSLVYNGSGNPAFFKDKSFREPVEYDLSFALKETRAYTRENFETGESFASSEAGDLTDNAAERAVGKPR